MIICLNLKYNFYSSRLTPNFSRDKKLLHVFWNTLYIGENTRLIYDIMDFTEENDIPGLLLFIDFEKAFDSVSWNFLYIKFLISSILVLVL